MKLNETRDQTQARLWPGDAPMSDNPFFKWLESLEEPTGFFVEALTQYFKLTIESRKGYFNSGELDSLKLHFKHFWWCKHHPE
jgi:hypothetical protein